jgi:hypothetical protein
LLVFTRHGSRTNPYNHRSVRSKGDHEKGKFESLHASSLSRRYGMNICRHIGHTVPGGHDLSRRNPERMARSYNRKIDRITDLACCYRVNPNLLYPNRLDQRLANNCLGTGAVVITSLNCQFLNDIHPVHAPCSLPCGLLTPNKWKGCSMQR